jgi:uncharacterized protein
MKLNISPDLKLPIDTVTSTLVVYGGKGMGKTNFGSVLVEELSRANLRWSYLDPLGVVWGLRHSADGAGNGVECVILGGAHGDIPIEPTGGAVVADFVVDEPVSVIVDFSRKPSGEMWGIGEKTRFITDYAKRLFQRQGGLVGGHRREPIFQILDEAARYIPQMIPHGNPQLAECVAAWETLAEEGRNVGIGVCFLTQRSARMNKSVSEIADAMFAFRTVGPNSIGAITDWLGEHIPKDRVRQHVETLRSLDRGICLVVSPGWLKFEDVVHIRPRETFDSSATPKPGERQQRITGPGAKPDLEKYAERMKETIERAKESDPGTLKKRIRELEAELKKKPAAAPAAATRPNSDAEIRKVRKEAQDQINVVVHANKELLRKGGALVRSLAELAKKAAEQFIDDGRVQTIKDSTDRLLAEHPAPSVRREAAQAVRPTGAATASPVDSNGDLSLTGPERKILKALGELRSIGKEVAPKSMVAGWSGYSPEGGAFGNPMGALRTKGLIDYPQPAQVKLTDAGLALVGDCDPPTVEDIRARILGVCTGPERKILGVLLDLGGPTDIAKVELAERSGYSVEGGAFGNPMGALRTKGFVDYPQPGMVRAQEWLFEG